MKVLPTHHIPGSLGNMFTYRGFRLNVFFTYAFGNVVRLDPKFRARYNDLVSMTNAFKNRWMAPGEEKETDVPGILSKSQYMANTNVRLGYNAYNYSDARIAKGDFIRLKEISLGYDFPAQMFQNSMIKNVSLKLKLPTSSCSMLTSDSMVRIQSSIMWVV